MTIDTQRPAPAIDADTRGFWTEIVGGHLMIWRCTNCGAARILPSASCKACGHAKGQWVRASGTGEIYSLTELHRPLSPVFGDPPQCIAIVQLTEGPHVMGTMLDGPAAIGDAVRFEPIAVTDGRAVLGFRRLV